MDKKNNKMYILTIVLTVVLLGTVVAQTFISFYSNSISKAEALGQSCLAESTQELKAYIDRGMNTLKVAANSVEYRIAQGDSAKEIESYLIAETEHCVVDIDPNFTGIYGWVKGEYVDGSGWNPLDDYPDGSYIPKERDWYIHAAEKNGDTALVPPYVDSETKQIIISMARLLSDGDSVISLDLVLDNVQELIRDINLDGNGYGFIITNDGLIVAHNDIDEKGLNYLSDENIDSDKSELARKIISSVKGSFRFKIEGERSTVFTDRLFDEWNVVEEYAQMKIHPITGYHILREIYNDKDIYNGAKYHHERYDGKGYPNGLKGENIPEIGRIIGVADAYDAMASNRSYRKALPQEVVRGEIEKGIGKQFDPNFAKIMLRMIDEDKDYKMSEEPPGSKKILFIDDDELIHEIVKNFAAETGHYNFSYALNGEEGLKMLREDKFDLVLLDIYMPGLNGFEVMEEIRKTSEAPVVFLTGDKDAEIIRKISATDASDYMTKPIFPAALREIIHSIINV